MKKLLFFIFIASALSANAQNDTIWRKGGLFSLNFNQANFYQWSGGNNNSLAGNAFVSVFAKYAKKGWSWDNTAELGLGAVKQGRDGDLIKSDDKIDINSKLGHVIKNKVFFAALGGFRSQFTEGFAFGDAGKTRISNFLAPAYILASLGIDYKPSDAFTAFISPITSRTILVKDKALSDAGAFGVKPGKTVSYEFGAYFTAKFKKNLMENVLLSARLDLFSNYLDTPKNVDVNLDVLIAFKINKVLQASINSTLIYDDNTIVPVALDNGGYRNGKGVQLKNVIGVGIAYKIQGYTVR